MEEELAESSIIALRRIYIHEREGFGTELKYGWLVQKDRKNERM